VVALAAVGSDLYVGGSTFSQAGIIAANRIAKYDTTKIGNAGWSTLGDGVNNAVRALSAIGANLYVGGSFTQAGGSVMNRIAKYDTTQTGNVAWAALDDGVNSTVWVLDAILTDLFVGGQFTQAGGSSENARLARYNTAPDQIFRDRFDSQ
jgi:hypothetical protein